jgi:hypothetical protein
MIHLHFTYKEAVISFMHILIRYLQLNYICTAYYSAVLTGTIYILSLLSLKN